MANTESPSEPGVRDSRMPTGVVGSNRRGKRWSMRSLQSLASVLANIAVILGLAFAAWQILESRAQERVRIAVDATAPVYSPQFLSAYMNVIECSRRGTAIPRDDLVFVTNIYDSIAILYLRGVADGAIIRGRIGTGVPELIEVLNREQWSSPATANLQRMAIDLNLTLQASAAQKQ